MLLETFNFSYELNQSEHLEDGSTISNGKLMELGLMLSRAKSGPETEQEYCKMLPDLEHSILETNEPFWNT